MENRKQPKPCSLKTHIKIMLPKRIKIEFTCVGLRGHGYLLFQMRLFVPLMRVHQSNGAADAMQCNAMQWNGDATPHRSACTCMAWPGRPGRCFFVSMFTQYEKWIEEKITNHHHIYYKYNLHACSSRDMNIAHCCRLPCSSFYCFSLSFHFPFSVVQSNDPVDMSHSLISLLVQFDKFHFEETMLDDKCRQNDCNNSSTQKAISNTVNGHPIACRLGNVCFALHNLCAICAIFHRVN